jgi:hypothetical protein
MIELVKAITAILTPLSISAVYCIGLVSCGLCCMSGVGLSRQHWPDVPLSIFLGVAFSLGSGLAATLWLILSLVGLFKASLVLGLLATAIVFSTVLNRVVWREVAEGLRNILLGLRDESWSWRLLFVAMLGLIVVHGVSALHPALGDSVAFYLPWSRVIADAGRVIRLPGYEVFSDIWTIAEIQIAAIMMVSNDFAAKSLPFWHAVFAAVLLWGVARSASLGLRGCILIVAMLFTSSAITLITWDGKTDLVALPIGLAALIMAALKTSEFNKRQSLVIGLLTGAAVAAKLSYIPILGVGIVFLSCWRVWERFRCGNRNWKEGCKAELASLLIVGAAAALIIAPQMLRNWALTGEPFAPIYYFGDLGFGLDRDWLLDQDWFSASTSKRILLTYPLALTFGSYWAQYGTISVLVLAFLPLCLVFNKRQPRMFLLFTLAAVSGIAIWALLRTSVFAPRYILCSLALFFIFVAAAAARVSYFGSRLLKASVVAMTSYAIWVSLYSFAPILSPSVSYARGGDIESYTDDDTFVLAQMLNATVPAGTRLTLVSYYRYPLRADLLECAIGVTPIRPGNLKDYFIDGSRYVVFDQVSRKSEMDRILGDVPPWLAMKQIYNGYQLAVFEMVALDGAPKAGFECKKNGSVWHRAAID